MKLLYFPIHALHDLPEAVCPLFAKCGLGEFEGLKLSLCVWILGRMSEAFIFMFAYRSNSNFDFAESLLCLHVVHNVASLEPRHLYAWLK